jgi:prepilin-type N-terminal cleavage/methylation domain-containing protein
MMKCHRKPRGNHAFTLIELIVSIAIIAILAGGVAPLYVKIMNQKRSVATKRSLKLAYEAMFGKDGADVPSLMHDIGFNPLDLQWNQPGGREQLKVLVQKQGTPWASLPDYRERDGGRPIAWGYRGPYWSGPVLDGLPVDAWGSPIVVELSGDRLGFRLKSFGPDKDDGADDLHYPQTFQPFDHFTTLVEINIIPSQSYAASDVPIEVLYPPGAPGDALEQVTIRRKFSNYLPNRIINIFRGYLPSGQCTVHATRPIKGDVFQTVVLRPGQMKVVELYL